MGILPRIAIILIPLICGCSGDDAEHEWCDQRTIAEVLALQASSSTTSWCISVEGNLIFRTDETRCRSGAYYLEDSTASIFVCSPNVTTADSDSGIVVCPDEILAFGKDTSLQVAVRTEGLYSPAKTLCQAASICACQNGLELEYLEERNDD
ncbi:MAG TPA: hypothetical protein VLM37_08525 [Fibrobacteraceae bacterium]|nr:hypothetical protein [Fibrobacteraceae bacterium]